MSSGTKVANQEQHARSVTRPQRPAPPGPLKPTRARRRPALIALGLALVALSVLASLYLATTLGKTYQVLAVNTDIPRGTAIAASDIVTAELPTGPTSLEAVSAEDFKLVEGKIATADLKPGQLLTPDSFTDELAPPSGQSIVGIALTPSQMPTSPLHSGDSVRVVETPATGGEPPVEAPFAIAATVIGVSTDAALGEQKVVDVQVASGNAAALAARAATGRVAIVIDAVGAG
ncbi:SAF domain-containing protein [Promicromonospora sp. MEB111]|uniref:SAF domain-containing protein n=1 Tax=Promicromonospora sp. MEB111 TaxID=3040301 RepID=UPI00254D72BC|nr:SAF domain-containing protein [Promicromonospora sp. MEB111]